MSGADHFRRRRDAPDNKMADLSNLGAALRVIVRQAGQLSALQGSEAALLRDALWGIGRVIDDVMQKDAHDLAAGAAARAVGPSQPFLFGAAKPASVS